jgi:Ca2+-binding EF-hand superfamily protein
VFQINQIKLFLYDYLIGKIDFTEFLLAMDLMEKGNLDEKLHYAFELYDVDKNGVLTRSEIETIIKMVLSLRGEANNDRLENDIMKHLNRFIEKFDENGDMKISRDEFCRICSQDDYLREFLSPNFSS